MPQDVLPARVSAVIGGVRGRHASARSGGLAHLLALIAGLSALPMVAAVARQGHCVAKGWNGDEQFWRGCFSDLPAQHQIAGLDRGLGGWIAGDLGLEQLPLLSGAMALVAELVPDGGWLDSSRWYLALWAVIVAALVASGVVAIGLTRPDRLDLATQAALSPVYVVAALLSADMLVVALVLWSMWAWSARRAGLTGVLLGLAMLGHAWVWGVALALVGAALARERRAELARALGTALAVVAGAGAVLLALTPSLVTAPVRAWWAMGSGYGSPWHVPALLGSALPAWSTTTLTALGALAAAILGLALLRRPGRVPSWAQLAAVVVPVLAITGKATPVQAALWVVPLAILAGVSWRTHLLVVAVEAVHASALWLYIGGLTDADKGLPAQWYAVVILARVVAWGLLLWSLWATPEETAVEGEGGVSGSSSTPRISGAAAAPATLDRLPASSTPVPAAGQRRINPPVTERP
ncbi:glycosyltransferase 87 family protein [Marihabitans asiaticum]|uniref:Alpha-1,2-mannosyltransferase n=1 Tax=Marihabitans asiaticum TaxID=415218 RepID=A0A560WG76_9MICO|nr:hypothetical protein FB557_0063 [Marihabitans asiaticum]